MTGELAFLSAREASDLRSTRKLSAREYVSDLLDGIEIHGQLSAFIEAYPEAALAAAAQQDTARVKGRAVSPLAGIPFALKDMINVGGRPTGAQSRAFAGTVASDDAAIVRRLREAGAILIGKLSLEECGIGSPLDELPWPPARNPWDTARTPGGSSSGCGAALAAGLVPLAIGTDTGGSVRHPAALCGVVGLKPSYERISRDGVLALAPSLDHVGLMARTAEDCSLLLALLAPNDSSPPSVNLPGDGLEGSRVGRLAHLYEEEQRVDEETRAAIDAACGVLQMLGCSVHDVRLENFLELRHCAQTILQFEAFALHRTRLVAAPARYGERCRRALERGASITPAAYQQALRRRVSFRDAVERLFTSCDFLITAVVREPACRLDDEIALERSGQGALRILFNLTGHPALSVCVGFSQGGLPLAMQVIGRQSRDEAVLAITAAYQQATPWHVRRPSLDRSRPRTRQG